MEANSLAKEALANSLKEVDLNAFNEDGFSALMISATNGNLKTTQHLISSGADVNLQNNDGQTALMFAAAAGHEEIVATLLASEANFNLQNNDGQTALMFAAASGHREVVNFLVDVGALTRTSTKRKLNSKTSDSNIAENRSKKDVEQNIVAGDDEDKNPEPKSSLYNSLSRGRSILSQNSQLFDLDLNCSEEGAEESDDKNPTTTSDSNELSYEENFLSVPDQFFVDNPLSPSSPNQSSDPQQAQQNENRTHFGCVPLPSPLPQSARCLSSGLVFCANAIINSIRQALRL